MKISKEKSPSEKDILLESVGAGSLNLGFNKSFISSISSKLKSFKFFLKLPVTSYFMNINLLYF